MTIELNASVCISLNGREVQSKAAVSTVTAPLLIYMCVITSPMSVISVPVIVCVLHISRRRGVAPRRAGRTAGTRELDAKIRRTNVSWRF
jgi:hypothetical protein